MSEKLQTFCGATLLFFGLVGAWTIGIGVARALGSPMPAVTGLSLPLAWLGLLVLAYASERRARRAASTGDEQEKT